MGAPANLHDTAASRLGADGQRYTAARRAVVEALAASAHPLSLPQLLVQRAGLAQSSAYRNLAVLERAGVVHRIASTDGFARYELAEDLTEHHHHLICSSCGSVSDFTVPDDLEHTIGRALARVASRSRVQVEHHRLDLIGACSTCAAKARA
jgi:Fe2+ or Zn2+ uptake regulation protein